MIYSGSLLKLHKDTVQTAFGQSNREIIKHPGASVIIPLTTNNTILFVKQFRYAINNFLIELPAGLIEKDESPDKTAIRELREEVGFSANSIKYIGKIWTAPGFCDELIYVYIAQNLIFDPLPKDYDEEIEVVELKQSQANEYIIDGKISDAKTIAALNIYSLL
tara:strand:- start:9354 stop:9845 length:492 start_codon:yes stop_codon:yes gene_type:complete